MKQTHWRIALGALAGLAVVWWLAFGVEENRCSSAYGVATWFTGYLVLNGLFAYAVNGPMPGIRK